jgi:Ribbon-helix-helix protein, copG family.
MARPKKDRQPARLTVTLDENDYQRVCSLADQNDVSAAWVIRRAVHDYLERGAAVAPLDEIASANAKQRQA